MKLSVPEIQAIIAKKIPEGRVVPEHTEDAHFYRDTSVDEVYPSVTAKSGILDAPHLKAWSAKLAVENLLGNLEHVQEALENSDTERLELLRKQAILAHRDVFEEAGDIGSAGHLVVQRYLDDWILKKQQPERIQSYIEGVVDSRVHAIARSAELFCNDFFVEPIVSELLVASNRYKYAGTLDALMLVGFVTKQGFEVEGDCLHTMLLFSKSRLEYRCINCGLEVKKHFCLVDWKSSSSIKKDEYVMQTTAYRYALKEMTGLNPRHIIIVRLDKKRAQYEVLRVVDMVGGFQAFKNTSKIYDWLYSKNEKYTPLIAKKKSSIYD